ncbi:RTA1 like protein-domain-containing protein [Bisporella sp. PMI_857]|nr:RTA1 like protein-domain-containing protein [Bisporella sp. PMI_857]
MSDTTTGKYIFYHYNPSSAAAIIFVVLFGLSSLYHVFQLTHHRTWYFIPFVIGGIFECVGYAGREISSTESPNWSTGPYIMQSLTILLAPAFFAASIYMVLGRIIRITDGESCSIVKATWLTKIFVFGDVLSFLAQSSGGGMLAKAKNQKDKDLGEHIITGGLGIQILFFGFFIICAGIFHYRIRQVPTTAATTLTVPWERQLLVLYFASILIMIRSIFRIAEYVMGSDGFLLSHEIYLYIFDATLMFITMLVFNLWHPSRVVSKRLLKYGTQTRGQSEEYTLEEQPHQKR